MRRAAGHREIEACPTPILDRSFSETPDPLIVNLCVLSVLQIHQSGSPITLQRPGVVGPSSSWSARPSLVQIT